MDALIASRWPASGLVSGVIIMLALGGCRTGDNYLGPREPRYAGIAPLAPSPSDTLRLVSFNVEFGRQIDTALAVLSTEIELKDADILFLQEIDPPGAKRIAEALGLGYVYYPAVLSRKTGRDFGNAVMSRWPIVGDDKLILPHHAWLTRTQRIATAATIQVGDRLVRAYSTHLATPIEVGPGGRREQLGAVLDDAACYEVVVVGGDLNSGSLGEVALERGYAWPTRQGPKTAALGRWDHIFTRGFPGGARSGTVLKSRGASDHKPVWARVPLR